MLRTLSYLIHSNLLHLSTLRDFNIPEHIAGMASLPFIFGEIDRKLLREYRCPTCNRLLSKGFLKDKDSYLEVMCRICKTVQIFTGEDAEIIQKRHTLIQQGTITGRELSDAENKQE